MFFKPKALKEVEKIIKSTEDEIIQAIWYCYEFVKFGESSKIDNIDNQNFLKCKLSFSQTI